MLTIEELVKNKTYPLIECRIFWSNPYIENGALQDDFFGICKSENGTIISLDGDVYSGIIVEKYEEWTAEKDEWNEIWNSVTKTSEGVLAVSKGDVCLTIWESTIDNKLKEK